MFLATILILSGTILESYSSPNGAPPSSCSSMTPHPNYHANTPQNTTCPYTINTSTNTFDCGSTISVTLSKISTNTPGFKGFLCQARTNIDDYATVKGSLTHTDSLVSSRNRCQVSASITHNENSPKDSFTFDWRNNGTTATTNNIYIVCTFVQSKTVFWVKKATTALTYSGTASVC